MVRRLAANLEVVVRRIVGLVAVCAALVVTGSAGAATYSLYAGEQAPAPQGVPSQATLNGFYPGKLTIHAGDRVRVSSTFFHTATFGSDANLAPLRALFLPDPAGGTYADTPDDFAGNPWYFESLPKLIYNVATFGPFGDRVVDDKRVHNSGVLFPSPDGKPGTATFRFPRVGSYKLVCLLHPGMEGTVVVKPQRVNVPGPATQRGRANAQIAAGWERAKALDDTPVPPNTVYMGVGGKETLLDFLPATQTVPVGTVVEFVTESPSEPHNAEFGPLDWILPFNVATDLFPMGPGSPNQGPPFFFYGSDPIGNDGVYAFAGATQHGNGVFATPLADDQDVGPLPHSFRVRFTQPGTYGFICQLHGPDMAAEIVVAAAG
jgi:plastocyanin